jgi:hypothetical protein
MSAARLAARDAEAQQREAARGAARILPAGKRGKGLYLTTPGHYPFGSEVGDFGELRIVQATDTSWVPTWGHCSVQVDRTRVAIPAAASRNAAIAAGTLGPFTNHGTAAARNAELRLERASPRADPTGIIVRLIAAIDVVDKPVELLVDYGPDFGAHLQRIAKGAKAVAAARSQFRVATKLLLCSACKKAFPKKGAFQHMRDCRGGKK